MLIYLQLAQHLRNLMSACIDSALITRWYQSVVHHILKIKKKRLDRKSERRETICLKVKPDSCRRENDKKKSFKSLFSCLGVIFCFTIVFNLHQCCDVFEAISVAFHLDNI